MTENYQEKLKQGLEYQDFVFEKLRHMDGMPIFLGAYASSKYQFNKGESSSGLEIKFDNKLAKYGNLFFEVDEKSDPTNPYFVPSGIMRDDNSWLYLIGNYDEAFIFSKNTMQHFFKEGVRIRKKYDEEARAGVKNAKPENMKIYAMMELKTVFTVLGATAHGYAIPKSYIKANPHLYLKHIIFKENA